MIGTLVDRSRIGIKRIRGAGAFVVGEIISALVALEKNVKSDLKVDWIGYARSRGFLILPSENRCRWTPRNFLRQLPSVAEAMVLNRCGKQALTIFRERNLRPDKAISLDDIGRQFGQTKQHANLIEKRAIRMVRRVLLFDEYHDYNFRVRREFAEPLRAMAERLRNDKATIFSFSQWREAVMDVWELPADEIGKAERLIFKLLDFGKGIVWRSSPELLRAPRTVTAANIARSKIKQFLVSDYPEGLKLTELGILLQGKGGHEAYTSRELRDLVRSIPGIERKGQRFQATIGSLRRITDCCERILKKTGRPTRRQEILARLCAERARNKGMKLDTLTSVLGDDDRFVPIGHCGIWSLTIWRDVETRTIPDIAAERLRSSKKPLHVSTLFDFILARRPVTRGSLEQALYSSKRFRKTAPLTWELRPASREGLKK